MAKCLKCDARLGEVGVYLDHEGPYCSRCTRWVGWARLLVLVAAVMLLGLVVAVTRDDFS